MEIQKLQAEVRQAGGKGPARSLRATGKIPGIFYGPGTEPTGLSVHPKELRKAIATEHGRNQLIELDISGKKELALVKDVSIHPLSREPLHVDFYRVEKGRPVSVNVPFETKGKAAGVTDGGELRIIFRSLPIEALPEKIPAKIVVDVTHLKVNEVIQVKDLALDTGVTVRLSQERTIVAVSFEDKRAADEEAAATPAAAAKDAKAAAKAPAKDAKKK